MSSSILKFLFPLSGNLLPWILSYRSYFYPLWSYEIHHTSPWESRNIWRQLSWSLWLSPPPPFLFLMWFPTPHSPATISLPGSRVWVRVLDSEWEHFGITWRDFSKETCSLSILCIPRISNTPFGVHKGRRVYFENLLLLSSEVKNNQTLKCDSLIWALFFSCDLNSLR